MPRVGRHHGMKNVAAYVRGLLRVFHSRNEESRPREPQTTETTKLHLVARTALNRGRRYSAMLGNPASAASISDCGCS